MFFLILCFDSSDRIIVNGREIIASVVAGSAQPFNFKEKFHLTEEEVKLYTFTQNVKNRHVVR